MRVFLLHAANAHVYDAQLEGAKTVKGYRRTVHKRKAESCKSYSEPPQCSVKGIALLEFLVFINSIDIQPPKENH